jgi:hypothetical protein
MIGGYFGLIGVIGPLLHKEQELGVMTMMMGETGCLAKAGRKPNRKRGFSYLHIVGAYYSWPVEGVNAIRWDIQKELSLVFRQALEYPLKPLAVPYPVCIYF